LPIITLAARAANISNVSGLKKEWLSGVDIRTFTAFRVEERGYKARLKW
jgi:hypothetical protein